MALHQHHRNSNEGFILVSVLWILVALATLATAYALYVRGSAGAFANYESRLKARALAQAGVELAVYQSTARPESPPSYGAFRFQMGSSDVAVAFRSENAFIDLNAASKELLTGLFASLGARGQQAEDIAARIVAWRTPPTPGATDDEAGRYRIAGRSYSPRGGSFQHVNELGLVLGLTPALVNHALPHLTVYSGGAEINVLAAAPEVLAALPGLTPERLHDFLVNRQTAPLDVLRARLGTTARYVTVQPSNALRITVDVAFETNRHIRSEIVILLLRGASEPYSVLSWRDEDEVIDEQSKAATK